VRAIRWRVEVFEPLLAEIAARAGDRDAVQLYCDYLHHRYLMAAAAGRDIPNAEAFDHWVEEGMPGIAIEPQPADGQPRSAATAS
jgi:hypothetical protein